MESEYIYNTTTLAIFNPFDNLDKTKYLYPKDIFTGFIDIQILDYRSLKQPGVYLLHHLKTDKVYIGGTSNIKERIRQHRSFLRLNKHPVKKLQEAYNDDEWLNIYFKPTDSKSQAHDEEQKLLDQYIGKEYIFNLAPNARTQKGLKHTEDTIAKMKITRNTPEMKEFIGNLFRNKKLTEEHKRKVSEALKGHKVSERNKQITSALFKGVKRTDAVRANIREAILSKSPRISVNGVIYRGCREAARSLDLNYTTVQYRVNSKSDEFKDWINLDKVI